MAAIGDNRGPMGWNPPRDEAGNYVVGPPRVWPRRIAQLRSLDAVLLSGQALLGLSQWGDREIVDARNVTASSAPAPSVGDSGSDGIGWRFMRRSGGAAKERVFRTWGPFPMHHILDPTGGQAGWSIIAHDRMRVNWTSGTARAFFGFWSFNTSTDETSKTGVGWWCDSTDDRWTSGAYDGTGTPSTTLHETQHSGIAANGIHVSLSIELNAEQGVAYFYSDGVLVDTFAPSAALSQMTNCPRFGYHLITDTGADCIIRTLGGGNSRVITYLPVR